MSLAQAMARKRCWRFGIMVPKAMDVSEPILEQSDHRRASMSFVCAAIGGLITFLLLRRNGGVGRHILAFLAGAMVALAGFGIWMAIQLAPLNGRYSVEKVAAIWLFAVVVILLGLVIAMVVARSVRGSGAAT